MFVFAALAAASASSSATPRSFPLGTLVTLDLLLVRRHLGSIILRLGSIILRLGRFLRCLGRFLRCLGRLAALLRNARLAALFADASPAGLLGLRRAVVSRLVPRCHVRIKIELSFKLGVRKQIVRFLARCLVKRRPLTRRVGRFVLYFLHDLFKFVKILLLLFFLLQLIRWHA
ncbi:MAG TPA: hypothetical protein EYG57_14240 [Planctomycetes bacterium]|nr:hypothetical protein [Planctomycetota bacterium]